jgi:nucleoside-diphosphate-sugar epimerase
MLVHAPSEVGVPISESWPLRLTWDYPRSKIAVERIICNETSLKSVAILRLAVVYDRYCHSFVLAHQIKRIYEESKCSHVFPGNMTHGHAYVHVDDVIRACMLVMRYAHQLPDMTVLLIGESTTIGYDDLQRYLAKLIHGKVWNTVEIPKSIAKAKAWVTGRSAQNVDPCESPLMIELADDHYELNTQHARLLLGWEPHQDLRSSLPVMVEYMKQHPDVWYQLNHLPLPLDS